MALMYALIMFGITAGYHRYFSHRSFRTSRAFQFVLALLGTLAIQKGVLWWAAHHRRHHRESDQEGDVHSPVRRGFWWSHVGWIMSPDFMETDFDGIKDMARYPELRWLNQHFILPFVAMCVLVNFTLGFQYLVWGCFVSTICLWHATFCINSMAHLVGRRVYETTDQSRNNVLLALMTHGEGWHNNHHYYAASVRQGFRWWQIDLSYMVLCALEAFGIVWGLKRPSPEVVDGWVGGKDHLIARRPLPERPAAPAPAMAPAAAAAVVAVAAVAPLGAAPPAPVEAPPAAPTACE
ncbi:MAG: acyl-CoA desaturase [Planctomycetes bacterium]|nr:acyl-CoA desaturase [Planctomycetota bacterium]